MQHGHPPSVFIVVTDSCVHLPVTGMAPLAAVECAFARSALETRVWAATWLRHERFLTARETAHTKTGEDWAEAVAAMTARRFEKPRNDF